jgi:hypothetical protein
MGMADIGSPPFRRSPTNHREGCGQMMIAYRLLKSFLQNDRGTVMVETVIVAPLLFWTVMAMFSYWDIYRSVNVIQKATYTVSDVISRQRQNDGITSAEFLGFKKLMNYLIDQDQQVEMRVTSLTFEQDTNSYIVQWSCSPGGDMLALTDADVNGAPMKDRIPLIADADTRILVETKVEYEPVFDVGVPYYGNAIEYGMDTMTIGQFIVTRPRLAPKIDMASCA